MRRIRVMIVDDAATVRKALASAIGDHPQIQVAGTAANGRLALAQLERVRPDVIVLDVEMPELDGLQTLKALRERRSRVPVIMFSRLTARGAEATLDALALGASDYVTKPSQRSLAASMAEARRDLVPRIVELGERAIARDEGGNGAAGAPEMFAARRRPAAPATVVAIGASTGGPNALAEILRRLPDDFPVPVVVAQHMPPIFTAHLAERLDAQSRLAVAEAQGGETLEPGQAWIAPGGHHLVVARDGKAMRLVLHQGDRVNSCRPSVDELFESAAAAYGDGAIAVLLTGMGQDGARGCERIREAGGTVIVQDEHSSVVWGMPGRVASAGHADAVLPLSEIADELVRRARPRERRVA